MTQVPALIKVMAAFVFILATLRLRLSLGNAFLLGALALGLLFGQTPMEILRSAAAAVVYPPTLALAAIVSLILVLSNILDTAGQMQRMLSNFSGLIDSPRLNLALFPALIGLLPMPGGAVFSAPMIGPLGKRFRLNAGQLSFINYWFRHVWEYCWPMYPGILLATLMADLNLLRFVGFMFPVTLAAVGFGWRAFGKALPAGSKQHPSGRTAQLRRFIAELAPILIAIIPGLGLGLAFALMWPSFGLAKECGLLVALGAAIGWSWRTNRLGADLIGKLVFDWQWLKLVQMVFAILIFKGVLTGSQAVSGIRDELMGAHIPLVLIVMLLPFVVGMVTGITIAFVGSTFPILIALIESMGDTRLMLAYIMLALVCGFVGVLISPLHLCLVLSNEYFGTTLGAVYRHLWVPCAELAAGAVVYFFLLRWLLV